MPDRKPKPPIKLRGGLPDGEGLSHKHALWTADPDSNHEAFVVVRVNRRTIEFDDETGEWNATIQVRGIEVPSDSADQETLVAMFEKVRGGRTAVQQEIPLGVASDGDRATELQQRIAEWASREKLNARKEWDAYFSKGTGRGVPTGPVGGDLRHLIEFVRERQVIGPDASDRAVNPAFSEKAG